MKTLAFIPALLIGFGASAAQITSDRAAAQVNVARVIKLISLVNKADVNVALAVRDNAGNLETNAPQELFFTILAKGELFKTDAAFDLGSVYGIKNAKRIAGGYYSVDVELGDDSGRREWKTLQINATKALQEIKNVKCLDPNDCPASANFTSTISVK